MERDELPETPWFACDFETTVDLDGDPEVYELSQDDIEDAASVRVGSPVLSVHSKNGVCYTRTTTRHPDGSLTATKREGRVRVWAWAIAPLHEERIYTGTDIAGFVEKAAELGGIHWFHNLRFDAAYLDSYLHSKPPHGIGIAAGVWRPRSVPHGGVSALISDQGAHYARYVKLPDGRRFEVRDSLKKFPGASVAGLAKMYGADQGKGDIDYHKPRPVGYRPTPEEWDYIERDVAIPRTALRVAREIGNTKLTIGGDAMAEYQRTMAHGKFRTVFPLLDRDLDDWIRRAYRGGWTYVNPDHQGVIHEEIGTVWDVNSMYPAVMRRESYPYGVPVQLAPGQLELEGYPHVMYGALMDARIKPGRLPIIQVKSDSRYDPVTYQTEVDAIEWYGTEIDWKLLMEQYDVEIHEWIGGYAFKGQRGLFDRYIDKWMEVKTTSTGGMYTQSKFQLNNLWGRFAINPLRGGKVPGIAADGSISYHTLPQEYGEPAYTPVGVWTTSYGRDTVIRAAQKFGRRFLAADTDSCHVLGTDPLDLEIHDTKLGAWSLEATFDRATYLRPKAYAERIITDKGSYIDAHVAGLPRHLLEEAEIEDIKIGTKYSGKLVPRRVPGGIILVSTDFEIGEKDAWGHRR